MSTYTRDGNTIYAVNNIGSPVKVAVINTKGHLQPSKGMGHHRAAVEAFLEADRIPEEEAPAEVAKPHDVIHNFTSLAFAKEFAAEFNGLVLGGPTPKPPFQVRNTFSTEQYLRQFKEVAAEWLDAQANQDPSGIPPCPPEDPSAGDKTPAVIAWWHRYHPEAAAVKYRNRKFQLPE